MPESIESKMLAPKGYALDAVGGGQCRRPVLNLNELPSEVIAAVNDFQQVIERHPRFRLSSVALLALFNGNKYTNQDISDLTDISIVSVSSILRFMKKKEYLVEEDRVVPSKGVKSPTLWTTSHKGMQYLSELRAVLGGSGLHSSKYYASLVSMLRDEHAEAGLPTITCLRMVKAGVSSTSLMAEWLGVPPSQTYSNLKRCVERQLIIKVGERIQDRSSRAAPFYKLSPKGELLLDRLASL